MQNWLEVFKCPAVQRTTYDRYDMTAKHQIYSLIGDKSVGDILSADIIKLLNKAMMKGVSYSSAKKIYNLLSQYFDYLEKGEMIDINPMRNVELIKKANFLYAQGKENKPQNEIVTVFTPEEIELLKAEVSETAMFRRPFSRAFRRVLLK